MRPIVVLLALILAQAAQAQVQVQKGEVIPVQRYCSSGPGAPLGISGYTCASCGARADKMSGSTYFFDTEPVITQAMPGSPFLTGDVITTMNGKPITTREAADDFAFPMRGSNAVGVRRWSGTVLSTHTFPIMVGDDCAFRADPVVITPLGKLTEQNIPGEAADPTSQIGFAVSCTPSCSKITDKNGSTFWKHDGYPAIVAVRAKSPAAEAGLKVGDLIAEVNGVQVTDEAGSRTLQVYASAALAPRGCVKCEIPYLKMLIIRDGERRPITLVLTQPKE